MGFFIRVSVSYKEPCLTFTVIRRAITLSIHILIFAAMTLGANDLNLIRQFFSTKPVLKAFLFGSYSRGDADESSDVDILVELDYSKGVSWNFYSMKEELEKALNKKVDVVSTGGLSKYISPLIDQEKKLIYEK